MNYSEKYVEKKAKRLRSKGVRRLKRTEIFFLRFGFVLLLAGTIFGIYMGYRTLTEMFDEVPDVRTVDLNPPGHTTQILDDSGTTLQVLVSNDVSHEYVMLDQLPKNLQNAFIAVEDPDFRRHEGIDPIGFLRSVISGLGSNTYQRSAATITEQLLKNQVFSGSNEDTDYLGWLRRTLKEMYMALRMENHYTKDEILEYYLNTICLGQNTQGVEAASLRYFNKHVDELTLSECAVLAATAKNPTAYNPITHATRNRNRALKVLKAMQDQELITSLEYEQAIQDNVQTRVQRYNESYMKAKKPTSYFVDSLMLSVIEDLKSEMGYTETQAMNALYSSGLIIHSTMDSSMQKVVDREINNPENYPEEVRYQPDYQLTVHHIGQSTDTTYTFNDVKKWYEDRGEKLFGSFLSKKEIKAAIKPFRKEIITTVDKVIAESLQLTIWPQASFFLMDPATGQVKALVGGRGDKALSLSVNRATDLSAQPGDFFSILSSYLPGIDTAGMTLGTVQDDTPYNYPGTDTPVENRLKDTYRGLTTVRDAIIDGSHVIAVKTLDQVTPRVGYDYLKRLGFTTLIDGYSDDAGQSYTDMELSTALGALTKGVTNRELTGAFATIANGGEYHTPHLYTRITDNEGNTLIDHTNMLVGRVMKDTTAWLITDVLREDAESDQAGIVTFQNSDMVVAGKGSISESGSDLWFMGYTPYLTAGIWCETDGVGKKKNTTYHREIWRKIMEKIHNHLDVKSAFPTPEGITSAAICTKCGKLAIADLCENAVGGSCERLEYYTKETVPTDSCDCHVKCRICNSSGLLAGDGCPETEVSDVVYLQKKDEVAGEGTTTDSELIMPKYLIDSLCEEHNTR